MTSALLTVEEFALAAGLSSKTVRNMLMRGKIKPAHSTASFIMISPSELSKVKAEKK